MRLLESGAPAAIDGRPDVEDKQARRFIVQCKPIRRHEGGGVTGGGVTVRNIRHYASISGMNCIPRLCIPARGAHRFSASGIP
jgi:hypothetical protein